MPPRDGWGEQKGTVRWETWLGDKISPGHVQMGDPVALAKTREGWQRHAGRVHSVTADCIGYMRCPGENNGWSF